MATTLGGLQNSSSSNSTDIDSLARFAVEEHNKKEVCSYDTCCFEPGSLWSNSVNIYVGIGVPWLIDTAYNLIAYGEPLRIENAAGLSFSLLVFFATSVGCISVLVLRRLVFGGELGGPKVWAWITCAYFMFLWIVFVALSSLKVSGII